MKYICLFLIAVSCIRLNAQCALSVTINVTPPTCSTCCNGSATLTGISCPATSYTWIPGATTGANCGSMCGGTTYTLYANLQTTACCGSTVGTGTVYVPIAPPTNITELIELKNIIVSPNPSNGSFSISTEKLIEYSAQITIRDLNGKIVYEKDFILNNNISTIHFDTKEGVYLIIITDKKTQQQTVKTIVVQK